MLEKKEHIAVVTDEYGCMRGIVTMEDIIETMLGVEIVDECDTDFQAVARQRHSQRIYDTSPKNAYERNITLRFQICTLSPCGFATRIQLVCVSPQRYNDAIKDIFTTCGITRIVTIIRFSYSQRRPPNPHKS